jgi:AcrR family transcriptional regulator
MQHSCCMGAPEPMRSKAPAVDETLRKATIAVLRERGFAGLTLERVAEVAGRARSTLWRQGIGRDELVAALAGGLEEDFRAAMYPVLTSPGSGRERLRRGLEALCDLLDRHLPLMLATDEAFHQSPEPGRHPDYLYPFIQFLREGTADGSIAPVNDLIGAADVAFNAVAWPYVHLRGRHRWAAERAKSRIVGTVLNGIAPERPAANDERSNDEHDPAVPRAARPA